MVSERTDYGIDAPGVVRGLVVGGIGAIVLGVVLYFIVRPVQGLLAALLLNWGIWAGLFCLATFGGMVWSSKVGKLRARDRLIEAIPWRGDEMVLDVGCGRGLLLVAAAKRLTIGKAIGVDIWQSEDQSGNRPEATWENARAEGVADRIEVQDGDARQLPFEDDTFDVVISSLAIHNIPTTAERKQAICEMVRVLKPNGYLAIFDMLRTGEYAQAMQESGLSEVKKSQPRFLFFSPMARMVTGRKPSQLMHHDN